MESRKTANTLQATAVAAALDPARQPATDLEAADDDFRAIAEAHRTSRPPVVRGPRDRGRR